MYYVLEHRAAKHVRWQTVTMETSARELLEPYHCGQPGEYRVHVVVTPADGSDVPETHIVDLKPRRKCACGEVCK